MGSDIAAAVHVRSLRRCCRRIRALRCFCTAPQMPRTRLPKLVRRLVRKLMRNGANGFAVANVAHHRECRSPKLGTGTGARVRVCAGVWRPTLTSARPQRAAEIAGSVTSPGAPSAVMLGVVHPAPHPVPKTRHASSPEMPEIGWTRARHGRLVLPCRVCAASVAAPQTTRPRTQIFHLLRCHPAPARAPARYRSLQCTDTPTATAWRQRAMHGYAWRCMHVWYPTRERVGWAGEVTRGWGCRCELSLAAHTVYVARPAAAWHEQGVPTKGRPVTLGIRVAAMTRARARARLGSARTRPARGRSIQPAGQLLARCLRTAERPDSAGMAVAVDGMDEGTGRRGYITPRGQMT